MSSLMVPDVSLPTNDLKKLLKTVLWVAALLFSSAPESPTRLAGYQVGKKDSPAQ
ncbi:hypothetical protein M2387_003942 [Klebsiella sp. BIGb0407]|nr:hypothetical protein [Klebsiella sp. BIGb0407]